MKRACLQTLIVWLAALSVTVLSADEIQDTVVQCEEVKMGGPFTFNSMNNPHDELVEIEKTIRASIEWAVHDKDTAMSYGSVVNNDELFFFQTDSRSTIAGFEDFRNLTEKFFMRDDFKAIKVVIKDLRIHMSPSMKTAWWSCILDDYNEFQGKPANWENVRWSGVLEKVEDNWRIFQMHFSKAEDLIEK
ncbi:MAG: nuclear transport factor 2 family protein [candidate division WOR-3 bacterium]|nr:MAG: nuclear transport factor 2 family protein [candidate division WOR-3 bacterium]